MHALAGLPDTVIDVIRAAAVVEYATMRAAGVPIDTPTLRLDFGIAKSRMERISRNEIIKMISSAMQHEEPLNIISEEAQRHARTS